MDRSGFQKFRGLFLTACLMTGGVSIGLSQYSSAVSLGVLDAGEIREASGLVASAKQSGFLWTHNDSGDAARIFLIDSLARHRGTWYLSGKAAQDWEEIGKMRRDGRDYLIVGDIGDNRARRPSVTIHIFPEPALPQTLLHEAAETSASDGADADRTSARSGIFIDSIPQARIQTLHLRYEDGPRDAEAFFYDTRDQLLYVITKRELQVGVYTTPLPEITVPADHTTLPAGTLSPSSDTLLLRRKAVLPMTLDHCS